MVSCRVLAILPGTILDQQIHDTQPQDKKTTVLARKQHPQEQQQRIRLAGHGHRAVHQRRAIAHPGVCEEQVESERQADHPDVHNRQAKPLYERRLMVV